MTLKQRLAELLPHFDDDGKLLPNHVVKGRIVGSNADWSPSLSDTIGTIAFQMQNGNEYRIESAPKRPRKWNAFVTDAGTLSVKSYNGESSPINYTPITVIEDAPLPVSEDQIIDCLEVFNKPSSGRGISMRSVIEHWEANRTKALP